MSLVVAGHSKTSRFDSRSLALANVGCQRGGWVKTLESNVVGIIYKRWRMGNPSIQHGTLLKYILNKVLFQFVGSVEGVVQEGNSKWWMCKRRNVCIQKQAKKKLTCQRWALNILIVSSAKHRLHHWMESPRDPCSSHMSGKRHEWVSLYCIWGIGWAGEV